ncbi:hypothetical protein [Saccharothrix xinjiangensis]|uniref:Uncharacterized protein n=1 Tax=Saccharothrix xinjiangensis TaxID=204798 RepID=A0ABV9YE22_9PSEU
MNDTEKLVAEALRLRAERTPPPGPVLAALHRPRRSRKPLLLVLATAGTVAAAVVAVTTVARPPVAEEAPPAIPITTTVAEDPGPAVRTVPLEYSPTWLPDGFTEWRRGNTPHGSDRSYQRVEAEGSVAPQIDFSVHGDDIATRAASLEASADQVAVAGAPGYFVGGDLHWRVREDRFLVVTTQGVPDARATALRVAESVRPDGRAIRVPVSFGDSTVFSITDRGDGGWSAHGTATHGGHDYLVSLSTAPYLANAAREVTARGRPAQYYEEISGGLLNVDLGAGRHLGVSNTGSSSRLAPPEALVEVAELVVVDPEPQVKW